MLCNGRCLHYKALQCRFQTTLEPRYKRIMPSPEHLLIVDDDIEIRNLLRDYLQKNGYRVSAAQDGKQMRSLLDDHRFDLIVLDLMLPGDDGLVLCRSLRAQSDIPVIMLTARGDEMDRVIGLEMGADDYLAKPFNPRELLARIKSVLRRANNLPDAGHSESARFIEFGGWKLDTIARHLVGSDAVVVPLSGAEFRLLRMFLDHPNRVLSRDQIMDRMHGREAGPFDRSIDVLVSRLRHHLGDDSKEPTIIKTVRGEGYVLAVEIKASQ